MLGIFSSESSDPQKWERNAPTLLLPEPGSPSAVTGQVLTKPVLYPLPKQGGCGQFHRPRESHGPTLAS